MATITQTSNANSIWNGEITVTDAPATGITHYVLYASQSTDILSTYRRVRQYVNPGGAALTLGPLKYAELFLQVASRSFFLRITAKRGVSGPEDDLLSAANPSLPVVASTIKGWTLEQLLEQDMRPTIIVGYDPLTAQFHPVNVVADGAGGFKLKV